MYLYILKKSIAWHTTYVDLLILAPPDSSGSLIRLLRSIEAADYFGSRRPHLRIELPADIDLPTWSFVQNLVWPPIDWSGTPHVSQLTLRHSIPRRTPTPEEASVQLLESFYPARPRDSHVLLLSPQIELSPLYYHYLMYNILEYKYSSQTLFSQESSNLMGLSLELPSHHLNDTEIFTPPPLERPKIPGVPEQSSPATHFLWQSPDSNAALYFGDKWIEFHSFLSARISTLSSETPRRKKLISEKHPSWMEYLLELMRARGYSLLYPNFTSTSETIATLHSELYQPPEEYSQPRTSSNVDQPLPTIDPNDPFITDASVLSTKPASHKEASLLSTDLLSILPQTGDLFDLSYIPLISHESMVLNPTSSAILSNSFAGDFRREIGGCAGFGDIWIYHMSANDLFCNLKDRYSDGSEEDENVYESDDPKTVVKEAPKTPVSTERTDDSDISQTEFAAHMNRQGGKPKKAAPIKAPANIPANIPAKAPIEGGEDTKKEFSDHLARQGTKKPDPAKEKALAIQGTKAAIGGTSKESHDTVVMQTDHGHGKKADDAPTMPADHVAGKKGEHAVVKIGDKASGDAAVRAPAEEKAKTPEKKAEAKYLNEATVKVSGEEKPDPNQPESLEYTKATTVVNTAGAAEANKDTEIPERKPGW